MERTLFEPEHDLFRESFQKFLAQHVAPFHDKWEEQNIVDRDVWVEAGKQGFLGMAVPEEFGGGGVKDEFAPPIVAPGRFGLVGFVTPPFVPPGPEPCCGVPRLPCCAS